jgi:ankyrin repeat protein
LDEITKIQDIELLQFLNINIHDHEDYAFYTACAHEHHKVVMYLLENGANIHTKNDKAIYEAISHNHYNIVEYLIKNGADINHKIVFSKIFNSKNIHDYEYDYDYENIIQLFLSNGLCSDQAIIDAINYN